MRKDSLVCFRLSKSLHESLAKVAQEDKRSLSSTIEIILANYLKERKAFKGNKKEKRQYPRKAISVPAFINQFGQEETKLHTGSITNISLGGVNISVPRDVSIELKQDDMKFEVIFTLPNENRPIRMKCEPRRVIDSEEIIHIGASFVDADFHSYKALQTYMM